MIPKLLAKVLLKFKKVYVRIVEKNFLYIPVKAIYTVLMNVSKNTNIKKNINY